MSSVSESISEHLTLGDIRRRYGISAVGAHHDAVTVTSAADALEDITPGALYISSAREYDPRIVHAAARRGAYAIVFMRAESVSESMEDSAVTSALPLDAEIPVLFANLHNDERARIAADMAGYPSASLAVFAVQGDRSGKLVSALYSVLHYLGNPLGVIDARGGHSLERELNMSTPLSPLDIQRMLFVMAEDGATSVILHIDDSVLEALSLTSVTVDVYTNTSRESYNVPELSPHVSGMMETLGLDDAPASTSKRPSFLRSHAQKDDADELRRVARQDVQAYGAEITDQTLCVETSQDAKDLVDEVLGAEASEREQELATAVTMVLAAGVKRSSIKSALRLAYEMKDR
ncbi:hypothetical protein B9G54_00350 [Alloscardovia macacae]|nr:hypothetical protein B9G54_00350 [Alloscardovia macacae]